MENFDFKILTDTKTLFSGKAVYCGVMTVTGSMGFEAFHEPFIGVLEEKSVVSYTDANGQTYSVKLESGIISFKKNNCTVTGVISEKRIYQDISEKKYE